MFDNRQDLADGLNAITAVHPTAVSVGLTTSDQDTYGFVVCDIVLADGSSISYDDANPNVWHKMMDTIEPFFQSLYWNAEVGEDKHGNADVTIPRWSLALTPYPGQVSTYTTFDDETAARAAYTEAAEAGQARARLYRGAAGSQTPISDTAVLIRLDEDERVEDVFETLQNAINGAGFGTDDEVSYNVPTGARNAIRAFRLREPLLGYDIEMSRGGPSNEPFETVVRDFLNDLHHLCNLLGVSLESYVERAKTSFAEEVQGEL